MKYGKLIPIAFAIACGNSQGAQAPDPEAAKCVSHRTAKQLECDDLYNTKAEIDACRAKVQAEINCVDAGAKDGGSDVVAD